MEMIAPLAKVLAEANGIDWQGIHGSGSGGQVVEQDILNYLSRIMTGEEEPPATPVDLPPADTDWNGAAPSLELLAAAGIDSDIADFVSSARAPEQDLHEGGLDFELELDEDEHDAPLAAPDEPLPNEPLSNEPLYGAARDLDDFGGSQEASMSLDAPYSAASSSLSAADDEFADPFAAEADFAAQPMTRAPGFGMSAGADGVGGSTVGGIAGGLLSSMYGASAAQPAEQVAPTAPVEPAAREPVPAEPAFSEPVLGELALTEPAFVEPIPVVATPAPMMQTAPMAADVVTAPTSAPPVPATFAAPSHAVLRLSFDAAALAIASAQLSEHFGGQAAPLAAFVARAAARHAHLLGLKTVGVFGTPNDLAPLATPRLTHDFRAAAADVLAAAPGEPSELMVADAGELGLDELQLPTSVPTLSLGRARGGQATLTLAGDVGVRGGAAFLREVAALLETPVRLLL